MMLEHPRVAALVIGPGRQMAGPETHMGEVVNLVELTLATCAPTALPRASFPRESPSSGAAVGDLLIGGVNEMLESADPAAAHHPVLDTRLRMLTRPGFWPRLIQWSPGEALPSSLQRSAAARSMTVHAMAMAPSRIACSPSGVMVWAANSF